jgi:rhodanese-related sulfurtransferase
VIKSATALQLKEWLDSDQAVLIDVREPAEYKSEHIRGAALMPLSDITQIKLPSHAGNKLVLQCRSGKRDDMACDKVLGMGTIADVYNLDGGIISRTQAGYNVETSGKFFLPLDRQVQLTIGLGVFVAASSHT